MSDLNFSDSPIEAPKPVKRRRFGRGLIVGGVLLAGAAISVGAYAAGDAAKGFGFMHHGPRIERIQNFVRMALDSVGATSDQEAKIHDIVAKSFGDLAPKPEEHDAFRKQVLELLKAPTIDKAAIEKLRAQHIAEMDAKSKTLVEAVEQAADVLTPDQRAKLADKAEEFGHRGPGQRPWMHDGMRRGPWGGHDGGADGDGPDGDGQQGNQPPPPAPAQ